MGIAAMDHHFWLLCSFFFKPHFQIYLG
jgi:hypothetical protein